MWSLLNGGAPGLCLVFIKVCQKKFFFQFPTGKKCTAYFYFFIFLNILPPSKTVNFRLKIHLAKEDFGQTRFHACVHVCTPALNN